MTATCPICDLESGFSSTSTDIIFISCPRCGNYKVESSINQKLRITPPTNRQTANISGWLRDHKDALLTQENLERLLTQRTPTVHEKSNRILKSLSERTEYFGHQINCPVSSSPPQQNFQKHYAPHELLAISWAYNFDELRHLLNFLASEELVIIARYDLWATQITAQGFAYLEKLNSVNSNSQIGFCAMWFGKEVEPLWIKAVEPAIRNAKYQPLRIDQKEHTNRIDDEIFADIRRSRFVVADFTHGDNGARGGVYFEAGFAQGLGLPVFWTCREDMLKEEKIHFDIRQYNFLTWDENNLVDFKERLTNRIVAVLGEGHWNPQ